MEDSIVLGVTGLAGSALIVALVQATVKPFTEDSRFYPIASILYGLLINIGVFLATQQASGAGLVSALFAGVMSGLAASGLYSTTQTKKSPG